MALVVINPLVEFGYTKLNIIRKYLQWYVWLGPKLMDGMNVTIARPVVIQEQNPRKHDLLCAKKLSSMCATHLRPAIEFVFGSFVPLSVRNGRDGKGEVKGLTKEGLLFLTEARNALELLSTLRNLTTASDLARV